LIALFSSVLATYSSLSFLPLTGFFSASRELFSSV
jgi:hypothetical protein